MSTNDTNPCRQLGILCLLPAARCLLVGDCGRGGLETIAVRGRVTFNGGPCPGGGTVYLAPLARRKAPLDLLIQLSQIPAAATTGP